MWGGEQHRLQVVVVLGIVTAVLLPLAAVSTDDDQVSVPGEVVAGTDPLAATTDSDGLPDGTELRRSPQLDPTAADSDGDGLADGREVTEYGTDPRDRDTDGDGLSDGLEVPGGALAGADPRRMDVFLELDYLRGARPSGAALALVRTAYAAAPIQNPDGSTGISLHIVVDQRLPATAVTTPADLHRLTDRHFDRAGRGYHYGIAVRTPRVEGVEPSGFGVGARSHGEFVFRGPGAVRSRQARAVAAALMHELGHSVGLSRDDYSGIDSTAVPFAEYASSMNYNAPGTTVRYSAGPPFDDWGHLERHLYTPALDSTD